MLNSVQVSSKLRQATTGYLHWCPGCQALHLIPNSWVFGGDVSLPTFSPSVLINGAPTGGGPTVCHYYVTNGNLLYLQDCTHSLAGQTVAVPDLPAQYQDSPP